ncbi:MAG: hypothetical protein LBD35_06670 [Prevotellaceae bacterium]|jgi:hypothetical protein|nr:hypothetical protein [Prevotellaceae bacterium]
MIRILALCLFLLPLQLFAQQDYKTIYENLPKMKDYEAFQTLFDYQAATTTKDFANVNGYYQLGLISRKLMRQYDPFLQSGNVSQSISNAKTYFSVTLHYFNEKEAKKNGALYQDVQGAKTYDNIKRSIEEAVADVVEYEKYFESNLRSLTVGITKYNVCLETFGKINALNSRLNDLYFLVDAETKYNLGELSRNFDSTLNYINMLKKSLEDYPMGGYKIDYSLRQLPVYRLHGLTSSNFLAGKVELWDFKSWLNSFDAVMNGDVAFLYGQAEEVNAVNNGLVKRLLDFDKTGSAANYSVNPVVINKMYKYDFNSLAASLLKYQEEKIRFLYHNADNALPDKLTAPNDFAKSNSYYHELMRKKQTVDSALSLAVQKNAPEAVKKYSAFFEKNYGGYEGLKSRLAKESEENAATLAVALDTYLKNVLRAVYAEPANEIRYKDENFYARVVTPEKATRHGYFIHSKAPLNEKQVLVAGTYVNDKQEAAAFAALLNAGNEPEWLRVFDRKSGAHHGVLSSVLPGSGFAVVVSVTDNDGTSNYIHLLDGKGAPKKNVKLAPTATPRKLLYDDIDESFLVAFKGQTLAPYEMSDDPLQFVTLNSALDEKYRSSLELSGYVVNIVKTNNQFHIYGGCKSVRDESGRTLTNANVVPFVVTVNTLGKQTSARLLDEGYASYPLTVTKISNEYADMICSSVPPSAAATGRAHYVVIK